MLRFFVCYFILSFNCFAESYDNLFENFLKDVFEQGVSDSPMFQAILGRKSNMDQWDEISDEHFAKTLNDNKNNLKKLQNFHRNKLSRRLQLSYDLMQWKLQKKINKSNYRFETYIASHFSGQHSSVPSFLANNHPIENREDAENYIKRVRATRKLFKQIAAQIEKRTQKKLFLPHWSYRKIVETSHNILKGYPIEEKKEKAHVKPLNPIFENFNRKVSQLDLSEQQKNKLYDDLADAMKKEMVTGYNIFIEAMEKQAKLAPQQDGVWKFPRGKEFYRTLLKFYTTTELTPEEIHAIGLKNVKRIHEEMTDIMKKVKFKGSLQQFFEFMRTDKRFYYPETEQGKANYILDTWSFAKEIDKSLPNYIGLQSKIPLEIKRVEKYREASAGKAFYMAGSIEGKRPGIYYANLKDMKDMPKYQMEALFYHEGMPGHHMQLSIQKDLKGVPDFQKHMSVVTYSEGWGLYSEWLAKYMGAYKDPYSDFGRLSMELYRAIRLVVDTGIHYYKWNKQKAIDYFRENSPNSLGEITGQIERYIVYPGQATSYLIGKIKILELFQKSKKELGSKFDVKKFHDLVLEDGPMPLNMLQTKVEAWIKTNR